MKTNIVLATLLAMTGIFFISCNKESTGNSTLKVNLQATNKTSSVLKSTSLTAPVLTWDTCTMNVSEIELEAEKTQSETASDSLEINYDWKGPKKVNLFSVNSLIGEINLQPGFYYEISIKVESFKSDAGSSPVLYLSGKYTNASGTIIPINVTINEDFEIKVAAKEGTNMNVIHNYSTLIKMNLDLLMDSVTMSDLDNAVLTNGQIVISRTSNPMIYTKIKANLDKCEDADFQQEGEN